MADNVGQSSPTAENAPVTDPAHAPTTANGEVTPQSSQSPQGSPQTQPAPAGRQASFWTQLKSALGTPHHEKHRSADPVHESLETIVFVVFLVVLLKAFVAEAFVIPTGSMATTLLGYHKVETCPECGHKFELNYSKQADAAERNQEPVIGCKCPNCGLHILFKEYFEKQPPREPDR